MDGGHRRVVRPAEAGAAAQAGPRLMVRARRRMPSGAPPQGDRVADADGTVAGERAERSTLAFQVLDPLVTWPVSGVSCPVPEEGVTPLTLVAASRTAPSVVVGPVGVSSLSGYLFDLATSLGWDTGRAVTNFVCVLLAGPAVLTTFRRASRRARFRAPVRFAAPRAADGPRAHETMTADQGDGDQRKPV